MTTPAEALAALYEALGTVDGLLVVRGVGAPIDPPAVTVGPPRLSRGAYDIEPTEATFQVAVVVAYTERAMDELFRWQQPVAAAIYEHCRAGVGDSTPGTWNAGGVDLPAYLIDVAYPL